MSILDNFRTPNIEELKAARNAPGLSKAAQHKKWDVRLKAVVALAEIGDSTSVPTLVLCLGDEISEVRRTAAAALGAVGDYRAIIPLAALLKDEERLATEWAKEALSSVIGAGPRASIEFMKGVHKQRGVRQAALDALSQIEQRLPQGIDVRIWADPNHRSQQDLLKLDVADSLKDLELHKAQLVSGLRVTFYGDNYQMDGLLVMDEKNKTWLGMPKWESWRDISSVQRRCGEDPIGG